MIIEFYNIMFLLTYILFRCVQVVEVHFKWKKHVLVDLDRMGFSR